MDRAKPVVLLVAILLVAFGLRCAAAYVWQARFAQQQFGFNDSYSYWVLGEAIAQGNAYQVDSAEQQIFRTPGYPLLLAMLFRITGSSENILAARLLGALLGTFAVGGVFCLARNIFNSQAGLLAAAIAALYPGLIAVSVLVLSEAPFCALLPFQLLLWQKGVMAECRRSKATWMLAAGVASGILVLIRPSWLLLVPLAIVAGFLCRKRWRANLLEGAWLLLGSILILLPWWIRNYNVADHFVPTTLQVGASLYDGLNPHATGASEMSFVLPLSEEFRTSPQAKQIESPAQFEYHLDRYFRDQSLQWATRHRSRVIELAGIKFLRMWSPIPNEQKFRSVSITIMIAASFTPVFVLGIWGFFRFRKLGWDCYLCLLPAVYFTLLHMIFVSSLRYRIPTMLGLIVLAAAMLQELFFRHRKQSVAES